METVYWQITLMTFLHLQRLYIPHNCPALAYFLNNIHSVEICYNDAVFLSSLNGAL